jgi:FkbM family methyltransferase
LGHIKRGWTVFDIGANLGFYSIYFSRAVGVKGHVYCFEANLVCVYFLQTNLILNHVENCAIIPAAILEKQDTTPFTINYASSGLGITQKSSFYTTKLGHEISVLGFDLDELLNSHFNKPPDLIKIDIEGAEEYAVRGMERILRRHHPILLLEIHGLEAAKITLPLLDRLGYRVQDVDGKKLLRVNEFLASFSDKVTQLICISKKTFLHGLY